MDLDIFRAGEEHKIRVDDPFAACDSIDHARRGTIIVEREPLLTVGWYCISASGTRVTFVFADGLAAVERDVPGLLGLKQERQLHIAAGFRDAFAVRRDRLAFVHAPGGTRHGISLQRWNNELVRSLPGWTESEFPQSEGKVMWVEPSLVATPATSASRDGRVFFLEPDDSETASFLEHAAERVQDRTR